MTTFPVIYWQLHKFPHLLAVAEAGSFHKAAQTLRIAQPALSKSMAMLENTVGFKIFQRNSKGCRLTAKGEILFHFAKKLNVELSALENKVANLVVSEIKLCTHELLAARFAGRLMTLPALLENGINLTLNTCMSTSKMIESLKIGEVDFVVCVEGDEHKGTTRVLIATDTFQCFTNQELIERFPKLQETNLSLERISEIVPIIFSPQVIAGKSKSVGDVLKEKKYDLTKTHHVSSVESTCALTNESIGAGLLPERFSCHLFSDKVKKLSVNFKGSSQFGHLRLFAQYREEETVSIYNRIVDELINVF